MICIVCRREVEVVQGPDKDDVEDNSPEILECEYCGNYYKFFTMPDPLIIFMTSYNT